MPSTIRYVPILKWKRAEQRALRALEEDEKKLMVPLIELVMPTVSIYKKVDGKKIKNTQEEIFSEIVRKFRQERMIEIPEELVQSWGVRPIYLDFSLLHQAELTDQLKIDSLNKIIPTGISLGLRIIPVLNLNDNLILKETINSLSKKYNLGICLRITTSDLINIDLLNPKIDSFLTKYKLSRNNMDLLIDIKVINEFGGQYLQFMKASQKIKKLLEWRTFIFACGSFPENLSECKFDEPTFLPRYDWQNWLYYANKKKQFIRTPFFADYTIRNPIFKESLQYYKPTTSIKYTLENDWLVMKGKVNKYEHYLVNAKLLVEDTNYFTGEKFSWGDENIAQKAKYYHRYIKTLSTKGTGNTEDWIAWCISHHLTSVLKKISNLP